VLQSQHVVIAAGISPFAYRPAEFQDLPQSLASHSSDHQSLSQFSGKRVLVVGGGQSAIESAVLLSEGGAEVDVVIRAEAIRWLKRRNQVVSNAPQAISELFYHKTDVGPPGLNQLSARPDLFRRFPRQMQDRMAYRCIRPAASGWLIPRAGKLKISTGRRVISARQAGEGVSVELDDHTQHLYDHVLLATGFKIDIARYGFLSPQIIGSIQSINGYPQLSPGLETSVPGLYMVGAPAAWSFGPLMRFVSGTGYTGQAVAKSLTRKLARSKNGRHSI
jgi:thioredoxin reductase